jgi:hypothetical protein
MFFLQVIVDARGVEIVICRCAYCRDRKNPIIFLEVIMHVEDVK